MVDDCFSSKIEINNVDCIEGLKSIKNNSIDLVFTSPPYYNAKNYSHWDSYKDYLKFLEDVFVSVFDVLKEGRMCVVNISAIIQPREKRSMESKRLAIPFHFVSLMEDIGFKFLEDIIWLKPEGSAKNRNGGFFNHRQPIAYKPNIVNEYVFVFQKPMSGLIDKILRKYKGEIRELSLVKDDYEKTNVWHIVPEQNSKHPAPFPVELSDKIVKYYSYVGDTVLDPFIGSGTLAVSCKKLKRNCVGFEIHKEYVDMAKNRLKAIDKHKL